jgi:ABC-type multidrug transport system fused ATPase/permease subunit
MLYLFALPFTDLRSVSLGSLRRSIGVVPQEATLFNDSIFFNIAYGNPGATKEMVVNAAKLARVHDAIMVSNSF